MSEIRNALAKAQEDARVAKEARRLNRADIIQYTKAIRDCVRLDAAVEITIQLVKQVEEQ